MANHVKTEAKYRWHRAELDWLNDDIRVLLAMSNSTAGSELDAQTVGGFTTLDEFNGANYTSGGAALASKTVTRDTTNHRGYADAADVTFSALGAGTRNIIGALVYKFVTNLSSSIPIAWFDQGGFPFNGNGSNVTLVWNAAGVVQIN